MIFILVILDKMGRIDCAIVRWILKIGEIGKDRKGKDRKIIELRMNRSYL